MKFVALEGNEVVAVFSCPQDSEHWPNVLEVENDDARYLAFIGTNRTDPEPTEVIERAWRDAQLVELVWLRDRHRDQIEIGAVTTLSAEQFAELLVFMQALRDWPQSEMFPDALQRPAAPPWLADLPS